MILFENMRIISWNPPAVTGPLDVVAWGSGDGGSPTALPGQADRSHRGSAEKGSRAGTIAEVGMNLAARYPGARRVASGGYLSPGLVCSHTHLYSALARGMMVSIAPSKDFAQQLAHLWWRLDRAIDLPILESSGLAGLADAAFSGVTAVVDHHAGPEAIDGSLSVLRGAYETIGLRGLVCYETTDRNGMEGARAGVAENIRFARQIDAERRAGRRPLVDGAIGGHAGFTVGEETLAALGDAVRSTGRGIHIHLGEDKYDAVDSRHRFGADLVERMDRAGCLTPKGIVGHGVWLTESEVETLNGRDAFLAHNARSNMNNAVGYNGLLTRFRNVILGTDGMSADMLEEFKFALFRHRETAGPWWPDNFLQCMDRGNRLLERYFGEDFARGAAGTESGGGAGPGAVAPEPLVFGKIQAGSPADLVVWDYDPPTPLEQANLAGHLAFGLGSRSVRSVAVNGEMIIENGRARFDRAAIMANAREQAARLWKRMEER
jgi:putative selenium metabolism protein SsnA